MIHYHGTPFSGDHQTATRSLARRHAIVSYYRPDQIDIVAEVCQSFILDNGAFSSWTQGVEFDLTGFMKWANLWLKHPGCDWAVAPDIIDGSEVENDARLYLVSHRKSEFAPVWHLHESLDRLERLVNEWPRVCFGSSGQYAQIGTPQWWGVMSDAMSVACDKDGYPKAKLHGLRMLDPTLTSIFPFSSCDSTNVARNIGIDNRWKGPYTPRSKEVRAEILIDRIEHHASASRWNAESGSGRNMELFG